VERKADFDVDEFLTELAEIGVGTAILGLRRLNIERRKLVEEVPALEPVVGAVLDQIEALAEPLSTLAGAMVSSIGDALPGERGTKVSEAGATLADIGPELLRLSGLTKRD